MSGNTTVVYPADTRCDVYDFYTGDSLNEHARERNRDLAHNVKLRAHYAATALAVARRHLR